MKKSILFITLLLSVLALPTAAQKSFVKNSPRFSVPAKADEAKTLAMSHVVASYYTAASEATNNCDNYYLVVSDKTNAVFNSAEGTIVLPTPTWQPLTCMLRLAQAPNCPREHSRQARAVCITMPTTPTPLSTDSAANPVRNTH